MAGRELKVIVVTLNENKTAVPQIHLSFGILPVFIHKGAGPQRRLLALKMEEARGRSGSPILGVDFLLVSQNGTCLLLPCHLPWKAGMGNLNCR